MKEKTKNILASLFGNGRISMMRVLAFFVVVDVMVVWTISCIKHAFDMQDVPYGVGGIVLAAFLGKAGQRFAENGGEKQKPAVQDK